jgi:hypothetical protein
MRVFGVDLKKKPEQNKNQYFIGWCRRHCTWAMHVLTVGGERVKNYSKM